MYIYIYVAFCLHVIGGVHACAAPISKQGDTIKALSSGQS